VLTARRNRHRSPWMHGSDCKTISTTVQKIAGSKRLQILSPSFSRDPTTKEIIGESSIFLAFR
jgi:hypothetical protein